MDRAELAALRDAIDMTLALPDSIRELLAQWLAPAAAKSNGHDLHPPVPSPSPKAAPTLRPAASAKQHDNPAHARAAERPVACRDARASGPQRGFTGEGCRRRLVDHQREVEAHGCAGSDRKSPRRPIEAEGGGAGRRGAPYDRVAGPRGDAGAQASRASVPDSACAVDSADRGLRAARDDDCRGPAIWIGRGVEPLLITPGRG